MGEMVPVPATFHHSPPTSNRFDNYAYNDRGNDRTSKHQSSSSFLFMPEGAEGHLKHPRPMNANETSIVRSQKTLACSITPSFLHLMACKHYIG